MKRLRKLKKGEIIRIDDFQWTKAAFATGENLDRTIICNPLLCDVIKSHSFVEGKFRVNTGVLAGYRNHFYRLHK